MKVNEQREVPAEAVKSAVELSAKYIGDRRLPDKAIDIIDEGVPPACCCLRAVAAKPLGA